MGSVANKAMAIGFRVAGLYSPKDPQKLANHARRISALIRPPYHLGADVKITKTTIGNEPAVPPGVPAVCVSVAQPGATVLYIHGGAFISGEFPTYAPICVELARRLNARVFWVDYRLAPEMPFPAAPDDCFHAYCALAEDYPDEPIAVIGDSAGGNLTLSTCLRIRDRLASKGSKPKNFRMPACAVGLSPGTDLTGQTISRHANAASDAIVSSNLYTTAIASYIADHDRRDPYASPAFGDYHGMPPLLLAVSENEVLRDEVYRVANRARAAGVTVEIISRWDAIHAWAAIYNVTPEGREDLPKIARFMLSHLRSPGAKARSKTKLRVA